MSTFIIAAAIICIILMVVTLCLVAKRLNEFLRTYKETNAILQESLVKIPHAINKAHENTTAAIDSMLKENHAGIIDSTNCLNAHVVNVEKFIGEIKSMIEERKSVPITVTLLKTKDTPVVSKEAKKSLEKSKKDFEKELKETESRAKEKKDRELYKEVMRLRKTMTLQEIAKHLGYKSKSTVQHIIKKGKANNW